VGGARRRAQGQLFREQNKWAVVAIAVHQDWRCALMRRDGTPTGAMDRDGAGMGPFGRRRGPLRAEARSTMPRTWCQLDQTLPSCQVVFKPAPRLEVGIYLPTAIPEEILRRQYGLFLWIDIQSDRSLMSSDTNIGILSSQSSVNIGYPALTPMCGSFRFAIPLLRCLSATDCGWRDGWGHCRACSSTQ